MYTGDMKRPTLRDIAEIAHVSHVTVSLALRKHRSIPARTRKRIEEIARQIGYRPDPALSALMVYRRGAKPSSYQPTLAWINFSKRSSGGDFLLYYLGAQERCAELGYHLEEFSLLDVSFERLAKILYVRNIQGIIIGPPDHEHTRISTRCINWDQFSAVTFGFRLAKPKLHTITNAQFHSARIAVRKLRSLGYRRIGYASTREFNQSTEGNFLGGFLYEQLHWPLAEHVPVLAPPEKDLVPECRKWFSLYKPSAIFTVHFGVLSALTPEEIRNSGIAMHELPEDLSIFAGIQQNGRLIGRAAVDEVVALVHSNQRGIPAAPKRILIEGCWCDGLSAPRITARAQR